MKHPASSLPHSCLTAAALTLFAITLHAELPPVASAETTLFSDDFTDNASQWTGIAGVNDPGKSIVRHAALVDSLWGPSIVSDGKDVTSSVYLKQTADLANGPISVYFRVRAENPKGSDGSRFDITLRESTGNHLVTLSLRPAMPGGIAYRDATGKGVRTNIASTSKLFRTPGVFVSFKLAITHGQDRFPATAEAFYYDESQSAYVSLGKAGNLVNLSTGKFNRIDIVSRNGEKGATWFDSVVIAQTLAK
jgi:hypothetical protein